MGSESAWLNHVGPLAGERRRIAGYCHRKATLYVVQAESRRLSGRHVAPRVGTEGSMDPPHAGWRRWHRMSCACAGGCTVSRHCALRHESWPVYHSTTLVRGAFALRSTGGNLPARRVNLLIMGVCNRVDKQRACENQAGIRNRRAPCIESVAARQQICSTQGRAVTYTVVSHCAEGDDVRCKVKTRRLYVRQTYAAPTRALRHA